MPHTVPTWIIRAQVAIAALLLAATACGGGRAVTEAGTQPTPEPARVAGRSYFGANGYIEYIAGDAPVILTAPHGGALVPTTIPDRAGERCGGAATTVTDSNTDELVRAMQARYFARFGRYPHVVIVRLSRKKLDANRTVTEAACGNADAVAALAEWHGFIDEAKRRVLASSSRGWYMDMHGHGHPVQRLELGYLLSASQLDASDATLDSAASVERSSSLNTLSRDASAPFSASLRGPRSLGSLFAAAGFPSIPSAGDPSPRGAPYFNGGDNTARHTCGSGATALSGVADGNVCGVQIETNFTGVRDTPSNRDRFGDATALVLEQFLREQWALELRP